MAFFNYSTMQMTAKIVYYGPGLCGKTTNLQYIYDHTAHGSRGEMVSLETQTDRTLFFDLLPMEVGKVAGFKTRIQLYTVPGQVFYNTTRKLVLKGVDGVVFVADSQRPMLHANKEALDNLEENLGSLGLHLDRIPLVLQLNKRDLPDICSVEELDETLNRGGWETYEASAITGAGVVETLRGISRLTLRSLKRQLESSAASSSLPRRPAAATAGSGSPAPPAEPRPSPTPEPAATTPAPPPTPTESQAAAIAETPAPGAEPPAPAPPPAEPAEPVEAEEVEEPAPESDGRIVLYREVALGLTGNAVERARRVRLDLRLEDDEGRQVGELRDIGWPVRPSRDAEELAVRLAVSLARRETE